jgi:hypothetical protein
MIAEQEKRENTCGQSPRSGRFTMRSVLANHTITDMCGSTIFDLPRELRNDIYQRVLRIPHYLYLFQDVGTRVETFAPMKPLRWLALLQVNRQLHVEAAETLFGTNKFVLQDEKPPQDRLLNAFLDCIGPMNSASLFHLCMDFPSFEGSMAELKIRDDSLQRLQLLQEYCTNLATLEMSFSVKHIKNLDEVTGEGQQLANEAFLQITSQLQSIPSLRTTIVRISGPSPAPSTLEHMRSLGWTILSAYGDR